MTTFAAARNYTDQWANLNFIIRMKKLVDDEDTKKDTGETSEGSLSTNSSSSSQLPASGNAVNNILLPLPSSGSSSNAIQSDSIEINDAQMQFEEETTSGDQLSAVNESQLRQSSSLTDAINIPIVTSSTS